MNIDPTRAGQLYRERALAPLKNARHKAASCIPPFIAFLIGLKDACPKHVNIQRACVSKISFLLVPQTAPPPLKGCTPTLLVFFIPRPPAIFQAVSPHINDPVVQDQTHRTFCGLRSGDSFFCAILFPPIFITSSGQKDVRSIVLQNHNPVYSTVV